MRFVGRIIINILTLYVVQYLVPGFRIDGLWAAFVAAIVIGIINATIKPVLQIVTLPISILTLGVTAFLINVLLLWLASYIVPGFVIASFLSAVIASLFFSLISWFLDKALKGDQDEKLHKK